MKYLESFESNNDKVFKVISQLKYLLEDEGFQIEKSSSIVKPLNYIILNRGKSGLISKIENSDFYLEFIDRVTDELPEFKFELSSNIKPYGSLLSFGTNGWYRTLKIDKN